ncbi:MAG: DUF3320 domain-containing protein [Gammaproteobacteria bacterium]
MDSAADDVVPDRPSDRAAVRQLFDETRRRLVETGTRNRLVHVNRQNARATVVNIVNERADDVYAILAAGKAMRFLAIGRDADEAGDTVQLSDVGEPGFDPSRHTDAQLETRMGPNALQKRLLNIAREAQTAEEESGVNVLYLALGFLTWFEAKAPDVPRQAPLVLLPVQLTRNQRTSTYDLRLRDEDVFSNLPLQQRMKDDFGIAIPDVEIDEAWTPARYFEQVEAVVAPMADHAGWRVERDGMQLGFFSFSKLLMYRDLAPESWPDGALGTHALTRALLFEGFAPEPPLIAPGERLDAALPLEHLVHVVDADASQAVVIEEVRRGRNLVVQGPPGTGKSQTIANIIAAAVHEGKRVLFMAEKMAALSVVHERLVKVGLRDVCLELHSRTARKKDVLDELARTLAHAATAPAMPPAPEALRQVRDTLNDIAAALHAPIGASGETPYTVLGLQARFIGQGAGVPSVDAAPFAQLPRERFASLLDAVQRYGEVLGSEGDPAAHPFAGVDNLDLQPVEAARLKTQLGHAVQDLAALGSLMAAACAALGAGSATATANSLADMLARLEGLPAQAADSAAVLLATSPAAPQVTRLRQALEAGLTWRAARAEACATFTDAALEEAPPSMRGAIAAGVGSFFTRWGGAYRGASRELAGLLRAPLPSKAEQRLALVDDLLAAHARKAAWQRDDAWCAALLGRAWQGESTDLHALLTVAAWCERVLAGPLACDPAQLTALAARPAALAELRQQFERLAPRVTSVLGEIHAALMSDPTGLARAPLTSEAIATLSGWLTRLEQSSERYPGWVLLCRAQARLADAGLTPLAERMRSGELAPDAALVELRYARAEALWNTAREASPALQGIGQQDRHALVAEFARLERARLQDNVTAIVARHLAQVPQGAMGEMKVIRGEIGKKRGHMALRKLFSSAGNALQRIKPVMLMSPISVAQYIPPGALTVDRLVIDEASQVRPEDALGAIARAHQIVVVGDQKQLPPSSFFDRLLSDEAQESDEEEDDAGLLGAAARLGMMESVLSLCEARGLNARMLQWHYRSRDPSLIQVSNREFYRDELILPPSPLQKDPRYGMRLTRVQGVYDRGGKRDNRLEGEAIVARVAEHARATPQLSLGVVTFSSAQKTLITELLELHRRSDTALDEFLRETAGEGVFVKNIENVQGDERDVILVSVGYGPSQAGARLTSMSFGPVNGEGGERRLNVLFTRARLRCEVFVSFDPADIDPGRTTRDGVRILKRFLEFAAGGERHAVARADSVAADSPFEEDVAEAIRALGYLADPDVGANGFRIDVGVRHPERPDAYVLAVECDGATYHGAAWARERDRLRQDVLAHLGWRYHRIWSTDWFYRRQAELERLRSALAAAHAAAGEPLVVTGARQAPAVVNLEPDASPQLEMPLAAPAATPPYRRFHVDMKAGEPHELPLASLGELTVRIVQEEGPIHFEEVARRVAACFGKEKAGARIVGASAAALEAATRTRIDLLTDGTFWFTQAQLEAPPLRDRSLESGATLKAANISMLEIGAALSRARVDNAGGDAGELIRYAARLLGFKRLGTDLQERLAQGLREAGS